MKPVRPTLPRLTSSLVLEVFDLPITFHRCLVRLTGSVTAALMLSQAMAWTEELASDVEGWFMRSQGDWAEETGLSRCEQETARRVLRNCGLLEERKMGIPARLWFRVNRPRLGAALRELSERREKSRMSSAERP
jgi:hypothetical protein